LVGLEEMKGEADYRLQYVTRLKEEITKQETDKNNASVDDPNNDLIIAVALIKKEFYEHRLIEQEEQYAWA